MSSGAVPCTHMLLVCGTDVAPWLIVQTILVIDDHVSLARAFAMALKHEGYLVHTAHRAEDGLRLAQSEHPDAIILDFRMPFINGAGFLYRLRDFPGQHLTPV